MLPSEIESKNSILIVTKDEGIFEDGPIADFIRDLDGLVSELHVLYIGLKQRPTQHIYNNTWISTASSIPGFSYFSVQSTVRSQFMLRRKFHPRIVVSLGDEISVAHGIARKYDRPLYVFYSVVGQVGKKKISIASLVKAAPAKVFVPNAYVETIVRNHVPKAQSSDVRVLKQYMDLTRMENMYHGVNDEVTKNEIFTLTLFPRRTDLHFMRMLRGIDKHVRTYITPRFRFFIVVPKQQVPWVRFLMQVFSMQAQVLAQSKDSSDLFQKSHIFLNFDSFTTAPHEPILMAYVAGVPVLTVGDEYSTIILAQSQFKEFIHIQDSPLAFGRAIQKIIGDPHIYMDYKVNGSEFARVNFSHERTDYIEALKASITFE